MASVYITGIAGFLGSHLADFLIAQGTSVKGVDSLIGGYEDNVPSEAEFHKFDMLDLDALTASMEGAETVYHTACTAYEGLSVFSPSIVTANTVQISVNAMTAAIRNGVKRFVHCSSMARYGTQDVTPFTEEMVCKPQDPYGISKFAAELLLRNLADVHGIELVIAVPHNIIGPRQKYDDPFRNVASIMANLMLQNRPPIIYGDGTQVRCFSDVDDDIWCLAKLGTEPGIHGEIYNIGPDENPISINELATIMSKLAGFSGSPTYIDPRPQEVKYATCSADKIRSRFGYSTVYSIEESLSKLIDYIKKRGTRKFDYHMPIEIVTSKTPISWRNRMF
jgi:UDP-glucose 4-epimerase